MDPARQSAIAGAILGVGVVLLGVAVVAVGVHGATVNAPRALIVLVGVGLMFCGAAFGVVTFWQRLAFALGVPGATLTFLLPLGWFGLSPGTRECTVQVIGFGNTSVSTPVALDEASCRWVLFVATLLALGVVAGMVFAWRKLGGPPGEEGR